MNPDSSTHQPDSSTHLNDTHHTDEPITNRDAERFWSKVDRNNPDDCWEWQAYSDRNGYGRFKLDGKARRAHRVAIRLDGRNPTGTVVRHTCDNPGCVNPHHLKRGTQRENVRDMVQRDRQPRGARNGQSKLTREQVMKIRESSRPSRMLADMYGVAPSTIRMVRTGGSWSHL